MLNRSMIIKSQPILFKGSTSSLLMFLSVIFIFSSNLNADPIKYKLAMLGYSDNDIRSIISGRQSISQLEQRQKQQLIGYQKTKNKRNKGTISYPNTITNKQKTYTFKNSVKIKNNPIKDISNTSFNIYYNSNDLSNKVYKFSSTKPVIKEHSKGCSLKSRLLNLARPYFSIVEEASRLNRVKQSLILAVIKVESGFNQRAVSPKGALGLMQLMPTTAKSLGVNNPFNPIENIYGGTKYLSDCMRQLNDLKLAVAAYNAGIARV